MRNKLLASAAIVFGATLAVPAQAEIDVLGSARYDKIVTEIETLQKFKSVSLTVTIVLEGDSAAQSNAVANQRIGAVPAVPDNPNLPGDQSRPAVGGPNVHSYNSVGLFSGRLGVDFLANITNSVVDNDGIAQLNQDVGAGTNQANVLSAAVGARAFFAEANNVAAQHIQGSFVAERGRVIGTTTPSVQPIRLATMVNSVTDNVGVVQVNQNAGVFNNQLNSAAVALGFGPGNVALSESDLGQWNTGNVTTEFNTTRTAAISGSVNNNIGVVHGNQAAGYMANQANMTNLSATFSGAPQQFGAFANAITPNF